ncbi:hypothetical protein FPZ43_12200 [Mucilaginibacter pallidiroseus]|uniref:Uncharacterized protein n=1 Tax=Mucilaginibacter pallidiroseus TaxID=2599295 RepID=A0A563UCC3_9SPHI|nr:hypothetical protein [Mucilaginibacter pallidiroseus]TWR29017.1 hypothetical protein FPZ43_12200 [Mucilaginibacter pallidiroseus]
MAKIALEICTLLALNFSVKAQTSKSSVLVNPFANMAFANAYKDTVTLYATYTGETGKVSETACSP